MYKEWKKKHAFASQVEIELLKKGVRPDVISLLCEGIILAIEHGLIFVLYTNEIKFRSVITFNPNNLQSVQGDNRLKFANMKQFVKAVKAILQTHHKIYIHQDEPPRKIILLND